MTITDLNQPSPAPPPDDDKPSRWRAWLRRFERTQPEPEYPDVVNSEVVKWEASPDEEPKGWAWVNKHALTLPDRRYVKARLQHAAPKVPGILINWAFIKAPKGVWTEVVRPVWCGCGKCIVAYTKWVTAVHLDAAQQVAEGPLKARTLASRHKSHGYRIWASIIAVIVAAGSMAYLYIANLTYFWAVLISLVVILDLIGRAGVEKKTEFTPVYREPLREGMPYKQLTDSIQSAFNEIVGIDGNSHPLVRVDGICAYDFDREEWIQNLSTYQDITEAHVRTLERSIGAALRSIRVLDVPSVATRRILTIKHGDPFTDVPIAPWVPTKSKSITEGLLLGKSQTKMPFRVHFAGVHVGIVAKSGGGKALALDTVVPTPDGWTTMGDVQKGDTVYDNQGHPCRVITAWPIRYNRPCYEVVFSDGSVIVADGDHLWDVETANTRTNSSTPISKTITTTEMSTSVHAKSGNRLNYSVRTAKPLVTTPKKLPIGPYTLGAWLGDGANLDGRITGIDTEIIEGIVAEGYQVHRLPSSLNSCPTWRVEGLTTQLNTVGLRYNKHIPSAYFRASEDDRRALLAGLLDTDGYCRPTGGVVFAVCDQQLALGFRTLVATLGYKSSLRTKVARFQGRDYKMVWCVSFTPTERIFNLPRKYTRQKLETRSTNNRRYITDIKPVPSVPVRCITVDSPSSLFLVGDQCIPTHNSEGLVSAVIESILACYNAVAVGIDLTEGPLFPIYGDCIQRVAYTPEDAEALLDWLLGIIKRRAKILGDIARSDDPNAKGREWNAHLAELYNEPSIHLIIDEMPQATKFNGQPKGTIDLASKIEIIARTGSKHWVTLVTAAQKTGKSDSGTTGISSQMMAWLVGPCTQDDANEIFSPDLRRAGWAPNLLKSAVRGQAKNDAGRCYVSAAGFEPVVYCSWTPMPEEEIKRRRARRLADGLPRIGDGSGNSGGTVDAQVVPNTLSALAAALDDIDPVDGKLPSALAAEWITEHCNEEIDATELAKRLRAELGDKAPKAKSMRNKLRGNCSCYTTSDINVALDEL